MTDRRQAIVDYRSYLLRQVSRGNYRATCAAREKRLNQVANLLLDGEDKGLSGAELEAYVVKRCRMNPMLWVALFTFVMDAIKLWLAWRNPQKWGET